MIIFQISIAHWKDIKKDNQEIMKKKCFQGKIRKLFHQINKRFKGHLIICCRYQKMMI
jgi:hypothetical protein